jgi:hypothetical protein
MNTMATVKGGESYEFGETIPTPVGIISYPKVWEPAMNDLSEKMQFSCSVLVPKQGADMSEVINEGLKVARSLFGEVRSLSSLGERNCPIIDGDTKAPGDPANGHWILPASCGQDRRPFVVDRNNRPIGEKAEIYGGMIGLVFIQPMAYHSKFGKGVKFLFKGVQKIADGKPFGATPYDPAAAGFKAPDVPEYLKGHVETRRPAYAAPAAAGVAPTGRTSADTAWINALKSGNAPAPADAFDPDAPF